MFSLKLIFFESTRDTKADFRQSITTQINEFGSLYFADNHTKALVGAAVAVGTAAGLAYLYAKRSSDPIPTK